MEIKKRVRTGEEYNEKEFPPAYLAAESLGQRDGWAAALQVRVEVWKKDTVLRPWGSFDAIEGTCCQSVTGCWCLFPLWRIGRIRKKQGALQLPPSTQTKRYGQHQ
eukprot:2967504-Ditylum_brightwellii.AAC.2